MPTVQPPPPPLLVAAAQPVGQAVAVVVKAPVTLNQLPQGSTVQATVEPSPTQSLPANQVQVNTALGPITLQTTVAIPKDAVLTLTLAQLVPQPQFLISELNGKPVTSAMLSQLKPGLTSTPPLATPPTTSTLAQGTQLSATLVRPTVTQLQLPLPQTGESPVSAAPLPTAPTVPGPGGQPSSTASALPPSAPVILTSSPQPALNVPGQSNPAPAPSPGALNSAQPAQGSAGQTLVQLPSGTRLNISIVRIDSPSAALNAPVAQLGNGLNVGSTVSGTIIGTTPQGQPIAQTPHAVIALETTAKLAEGARVVLKIESAPLPPAIPNSAKLGRMMLGDTPLQSKTWPNLDEALQVLAQADPARAQHLAQTALPQPGNKLSAQMLFFLSALKGGDVKAWLGENTTRILDRERPGLIGRLNGDFQVMSKMADEPQSGDWRLALVPLYNGGQIEQLRMYYRGGGEQGEEEDGADDTRFVLDLDLSNIGHLQIDGLMKTSSKKLDLIVRSEEPLPTAWRTDIINIFTTGQDITGIGGGLAFQAAPGNFIEFPPPTDLADHPGLLI